LARLATGKIFGCKFSKRKIAGLAPRHGESTAFMFCEKCGAVMEPVAVGIHKFERWTGKPIRRVNFRCPKKRHDVVRGRVYGSGLWEENPHWFLKIEGEK
jgi:hypothetical protein